MKLETFARRIIQSPKLSEKLQRYSEKFDPSYFYSEERILFPGRPENLQIQKAQKAPVPSIKGMQDLEQRKRIIHAFANHELQAAELYAWALLAFAKAPVEFRQDLFSILEEEQRHTKMYIARLKSWGVQLGDYPVSGYFWNKIPSIETPLHFVCAMALTFENANIDHTIDFAQAARQAGDERTASIIDVIHNDEKKHVQFGWKWLLRLKKPKQTANEAYCENISWPLRPHSAKGNKFYPEKRQEIGLSEDFIQLLHQATKKQ